MKLTSPFKNDESDGTRAVSPVIGVILMVAITVILAAIIGTFVLGLGDSVESSPQASLDFDYSQSDDQIEIRHRGGDNLNVDDVEVRVNGSVVSGATEGIVFDSANDDSFSDAADDPFTVGNSVTLTQENDAGIKQGTQIDVVFVGGDRGSVIASFEVPRDSDAV